ncbi:GNAT family N-acetyltransferase [Asticcacaulis sp. AND118]|uniref:GNAT family N-acetyltransferase n=1 Tax=Asticcacaulis sp. AND118 TaxID=2840468 RepID=UPI001D000456|nr:GNAT family N-acetyltransferase [Asticcacaulis sp. AND118]UDF04983.1 GNAT family N-acetyltransferase [Asticcacaulis sp. AND118]
MNVIIRQWHDGDRSEVARLFRAYIGEIAADLSYQSFDEEVASLPGYYIPPFGGLWVADAGDRLLGCGALRPLAEPGTCELKRLYIAPEMRGRGIATRFIEVISRSACIAGYSEMKLESLPTMVDAQRLYLKLGFEFTSPYMYSPIPGTVFMRLMLAREARVLGVDGVDK